MARMIKLDSYVFSNLYGQMRNPTIFIDVYIYSGYKLWSTIL